MSIAAAKLIHQSYGKPVQVLDIGANPVEGDAPYKALLDAGLAHVTGFEPNPDALAKLNAQKGAAETYHPQALGKGGPATLHLYKHSGFTSLYPIDPAAAERMGFGGSTAPRGTVELETHRLDDLPAVTQPDLLKIDVQGAEKNIISNGVQKMSRATAIWTEVRLNPLYIGEPSFGDLDTALRDQGFVFHDFAFLKRVALGRRPSKRAIQRSHFRHVVDGDALYIRDPRELATDQLFALAVLSAGVLESYELMIHCVHLLRDRGALSSAQVEAIPAALPPEARVMPEVTA